MKRTGMEKSVLAHCDEVAYRSCSCSWAQSSGNQYWEYIFTPIVLNGYYNLLDYNIN